jgi:hypothetical protein
MPLERDYDAVTALLSEYFDGLYHSDTKRLARVFHPQAIYVTPSDGTLLYLTMAEYFAVVDKRPAPASRGEARTDRIVSIEFGGSVTAVARVECSIAPQSFTDFLSLVKFDGRWHIMSKVFHYEVQQS